MKLTVYGIGGGQYLGFSRVPYGKVDTPEDKREYYLEDVKGSPVGTRKEIEKLMHQKFPEFDGVVLNDPTGNVMAHEFILTEDLDK